MSGDPAEGGKAALRINRLRYPVTALGPGRRLVIWVQGCGLACPGCLARHTWDASAGQEISVSDLVAAWRAAAGDGADGITVSGGEPLDQAAPLAALLAEVGGPPDPGRRHDILIYTGYEWDEATERGAEVLARADAVIVGRYDITRPTRLIWRGSANQRLVPLTDLGSIRYAAYQDHAPDAAPIQVDLDGEDLHLIGVPRAGDLLALERRLRDRGLAWGGVSWRP